MSRDADGGRRSAPGSTGRSARLIRDEAYAAAEETARCAFGRLVAFLARRSGDLAGAEDAVADAFAAALERWPRDGVPERPEAWLITAARRRLADRARRTATQERFAVHLAAAARSADERAWRAEAFPDERLEMLFACAHPAIDPGTRTPLVLRTCLGVDAGRIASAFLVEPAAMRQRLVRARTKIRDAGIAFAVPEPEQIGDRIAVVLDAIYAAFGLSWEEPGSDGIGSDLNAEAVWLARAVAALLPSAPEAQGLLALVLFIEARRAARRDAAGTYVALDAQDSRHWSTAMLADAESALAAALGAPPGRFTLEAQIQAAHVARRFGKPTDWIQIARLYDRLVTQSGAIGAAVSRAAVYARAYGNAAGLGALAALDSARVMRYQPYWAVRAHLTRDVHDYDRAIAMAQDTATRSFLTARRARTPRRLATPAKPSIRRPVDRTAATLLSSKYLRRARHGDNVKASLDRKATMAKRIAVITGASSGFGLLTVEALVADGWHVFGTMRNVATGNAGAAADVRKLGADVVELDVTNDASVDAAAANILAAGAPELLVNNAGAAFFNIQEAFTPAVVERQFAANVFGPLRVNRAFLPAMREHGAGLVVYVSSIAGRTTFPLGGVYAASKWALEALAEASSYELAPFGIDVAIVQPGAFNTEISSKGTTADDAARTKSYGESAKRLFAAMGAFSSSADGRDPADVARTIVRLANLPAGARPLRTTVPANEGTDAINAAAAPVQAGVLGAMGLEDLLPKAAAV